MMPYNNSLSNKNDLHVHTNKSDGTKTPQAVLMESEELGLKRISITDHESVDAYYEIKKYRKLFSGIIIPGIELKTMCQGREIELLGYGISVSKMKRSLSTLYKSKEEINISYLTAILKVLREQNIILPENIESLYTDFLIQPAKFVSSILFSDTKNLEKNTNTLFSDKIEHTNKESLYRGWLTNPKSRFYVEFSAYPSYIDTINLIRSCVGKVFIPHIFQYGDYSKSILYELLETGEIDGIECYYPTFTHEHTMYLLDTCSSRNLLVSGGSDYHGANKKNQLGRGLNNNLYIPEDKVQTWTSSISQV